MPFRVSCFWVFSQRVNFPYFSSQKSSRILREYLCRPLSDMGKSKNHLQYPSNTPKYTTSDPYWMQNNLFYILFFMHNNLKMIIKIFNNIYLSPVVLFPSLPLYWHHESWVHKTRNFVRDKGKGVIFQLLFLNKN